MDQPYELEKKEWVYVGVYFADAISNLPYGC